MKIEKIKLDDIRRCYCASNIPMKDGNHIVFASEDPNVTCVSFSGKDFQYKEEIWKEPGGCMSIIPIPDKEGEFLAIQEFYLKVSPSLAKLVWGKYDKEKGWVIKDVLHLPYLHRFDIYRSDGITYVICATIATTKKDKDDWSVPGRIYTGILGEDPSMGIDLHVLSDGLFRNHGYWHAKERGVDVGYFGSDQGILKVTPPLHKGELWKTKHIMDGHIGEIAMIDIDQDGEDEIMCIEAFHGDKILIYKKIDGTYQEVYRYANKIDFAHTLVGANLAGIPSFIAGVRRVEAELLCVQYIDHEFVTTILEKGVGPANLCVVHEEDRDLIVAANHSANEAAIYIVRKEDAQC